MLYSIWHPENIIQSFALIFLFFLILASFLSIGDKENGGFFKTFFGGLKFIIIFYFLYAFNFWVGIFATVVFVFMIISAFGKKT